MNFAEPITVFILIILAVIALDRLVTRQILTLFWLLTNSERAAYYTYAILLLPGTVVHEVSHWLVARLLGVPASRPSIRPQVRGDNVVLGYVQVAQTDPIRQSLIGAAPIVVGSVLIVWIAQNVFGFRDAQSLLDGIRNLRDLVATVNAALQVEDAWLWLYLLFSVSNVMLPSESDRVAWPRVFFLVTVVAGVIVLLVGVPQIPMIMHDISVLAVRALMLAFLLTILIDVPVYLAFWVGTQLVAAVR